MAKTLKDFEGQLATVLQDAAAKLSPDDRKAFIDQAIAQRYSKDRPREIVSDALGNGTVFLDLPTAEGAVFEENFSQIRQVEYPVDEEPASVLEGDDWSLYRKTTGLTVRLTESAPIASEYIRFTWTARHKADGSTVADYDFAAVCDYAAGLCFSALAAKFAQTGDPSMGADTVNYRSKSQEYMSLGKAAKARYFEHMGIDAGTSGDGSSVGPAIAIGDADNDLGGGLGDRLTHGRRTR